MHDFHLHSNYSDGSFLLRMVRAAESAGLEGIGFADHCTVSARDGPRSARATHGFNLDLTYERRRRALERVRDETEISVYDAVEMDYHPEDETEIRSFLEEANFDYAIGSVHELAGRNVQVPTHFSDESDAQLDALVERYVQSLVELFESELFDVAAHIDLFERTEPLAERATVDQYRRIVRALEASRTVPEINAGRALGERALVHPRPRLLEMIRDRGVEFTLGTDSHAPAEIESRAPFLREFVDENGIEPIAPPRLEGLE
ncbi:histidinol phosphatase [Halostagnicola larsenii XH-48]|uniref:histidinol-phosphatase n=1 Tax=Halostagnicola larsenii XH-48 TaxID=797299 RepID=W0JQH7_9EURY|nr:PHP domain-containing protein [Halostagnicola larsenii]AHF99536.1 histidinol phosphatase [Halostagnicola larsenii XH-48]